VLPRVEGQVVADADDDQLAALAEHRQRLQADLLAAHTIKSDVHSTTLSPVSKHRINSIPGRVDRQDGLNAVASPRR
jgi:hypothetical protein